MPPRREPPARSSDSADRDPLFPDHLFTRPNSVFVYGPSRTLVNLTLFAFAEATNPQFHWVEIGVPGEEEPPFDPTALGWVPDERLWHIDRPESLRPDDLTANLALFSLIRSDEPPSALTQVAEFLRLPEVSQRILASRSLNGTPNVVAVANAHRVMSTFAPSRVSSILNVHLNAGFSVLVVYTETAGVGRNLFDFVFRVEGENAQAWQSAQLLCEKGIQSGPLSNARPVRLEEIPLLAGVLSQAFAGR